MTIGFDIDELRPLIVEVVAQVLGEVPPSEGQLAYLEADAASLLGISPHQLRDARLRGEITGVKLGGRLGYTHEELTSYLARQRVE